MDSNLVSLGEFLTSKDFERINIPIYQRAYSWEIKHLDQFLDDIDLHLSTKPQDNYQFLGMIVYVKKENKNEIEIIDGQQRLTTFYLISSIIFDWVKHERRRGEGSQKIKSEDLEMLERQLRTVENILFTNESVINWNKTKKRWYQTKLYTDNTTKRDKEITEYMLMDYDKLFEELKSKTKDGEGVHEWTKINISKTINPLQIRHRLFNPVKGGRPILKDLPINTSKARPITKNYNYLKEWFDKKFLNENVAKDKRAKMLSEIIEVITNKLKIIPFKTGSHREAFSLFEVLNDRGMKVSPSDLLKNLCIKKGETFVEQKEMYEKWNEAIDKHFKESAKILFLRTSHNSKYDFISKNDLYGGYKSLLKNKSFEETLRYVETDLNEDAENFNKCLLEGEEVPQAIQKWITLLYHTDTTQWRTIALSLLRREDSHQNNEKAGQLLEQVFEIIFTMVANNIRFNLIENLFPSYAKEIYENNSIDLIIQALKVFKNKNNLSYKAADIDINDYKQNKFCSLVLYMFKSTQEELHQKKYTVEHILPQTPKHKDWFLYFPMLFDKNEEKKEKEEERSVYSIGNMILVEDKQNKSLGNKSFNLKKIKIKSMGIHDVFDSKTPFSISSQKNWTQDTINARKDEIQRAIKEKFSKDIKL